MEYKVTRYGDSDELMHWKYIKRVKKNGKWRYYYDESANQLRNLEKEHARANYQYNKNFDNFYKNRYEGDLKRAKTSTERENVKRWYKDPTIKSSTKDTYSFYGKSGYHDRKQVENAQYRKDKRASSIGGKVDKFMSKNGRKIAKRLNDSSDAIDRGKKKVASLFKKLKR